MVPLTSELLDQLEQELHANGELTWEWLNRMQRRLYPNGQRHAEFPTPTWQVRQRSVITLLTVAVRGLEAWWEERSLDPRELTDDERRFATRDTALIAAIRHIDWKAFALGHDDGPFLLRDIIEDADAFATVPSWQREPFLRFVLMQAIPGISTAAWVAAARMVGMERKRVAAVLRDRMKLTKSAHCVVFTQPNSIVGKYKVYNPDPDMASDDSRGISIFPWDIPEESLTPWGQFDNDELCILIFSLLPAHATDVMNLANALALRFGIVFACATLLHALPFADYSLLNPGTTLYLGLLPRIMLSWLLHVTKPKRPLSRALLRTIMSIIQDVERNDGYEHAGAVLDQIMRWNGDEPDRFCLVFDIDQFEEHARLYFGKPCLPDWMANRIEYARRLRTSST